MAQWHNKHIGTQWGVAIIGFMVVVVALLIPVLGQSTGNRSHAMYSSDGGNTTRCATLFASKCMYVGQESPKGGVFLTGYCPGPTNYKCYVTLSQAVRNCAGSFGMPASSCTAAQKAIADVNHDGRIDVVDLNTALRREAGY